MWSVILFISSVKNANLYKGVRDRGNSFIVIFLFDLISYFKISFLIFTFVFVYIFYHCCYNLYENVE